MNRDSERDLETAGLALTPLEIVAPLFGGGGVVTAITVAVFRAGSSVWLSRRAQRRLASFLEQLRADVGGQAEEFERRLSELESAEDLAVRAIRAAATVSTERQARSLADVLAQGVLGDAQDADSAELMVAVLDGMTKSEVEGLRALDDAASSRASEAGPSASSVLSEGRADRAPTADAVLARLIGRGLVAVDPPGFGGFQLSALGKRTVDVLHRPEDLPPDSRRETVA